ncbi:LBF_2017 N-terminal domain-containing protein [Leptospira paudalimensis]|uniref:Ig-like domain-containing protein n=1 Tax=Leptospira paudalimensis TaxID=2950024 RepID=A0ABT3M6J9_9LEPT|nr:hypothetical protein [Leptospira paudalimensis]MCW7503998.1 hypothetical protein [Leptospira paudalimensis]
MNFGFLWIKSTRIRILLFFLCFTCHFQLQAKQVQFSLVPDREDIIQYEIELWKTEELGEEIPFRVLANPGPISLFIPDGYEFFRIRAIAKRKVRGFWTEMYKVALFGKKPKPITKPIAKIPVKTDVLVPIPTKDGKPELFLTTNQITIVPTSVEKKIRIQYRINGGPWQTTTSPLLNFSKDGNYRLEYKVTNELGISDGMQVWEFKVDTKPPFTTISFLDPPFQKKGTTFMSSKNGLLLHSSDEGSGLSNIRYRTSCGDDQVSDYNVWLESSWMEILSGCDKNILLEISAVDRLGNEEVPKQIIIQTQKKAK